METTMETGSEIPRASIGEPHFEEDWTVQEARPVIPLEEIKAARHRKFAFRLVGAFAIAVILGAITALVSIRLKQTPSVPTEEAVAIADDKPAVPTPNKTSEAETEVAELDDQPAAEEEKPAAEEERPAAEEEKPVVLSERKSAAPPVKPVRQIKTKPEPAAEVDLDNTPEPRPILVDQWEERRARRVMRRERQERRAQRNRDLIRIEELFEGKRPN